MSKNTKYALLDGEFVNVETEIKDINNLITFYKQRKAFALKKGEEDKAINYKLKIDELNRKIAWLNKNSQPISRHKDNDAEEEIEVKILSF